LLVQHTARPVYEQANVFVKLNVVRKKYHCLSQCPDPVTNFSSQVSRGESRIVMSATLPVKFNVIAGPLKISDSSVIDTRVIPADVVTHDDEDVRFLCRGWCR
jgi:hypothetical protein